jgi:hypothetical protein
MKKSVWITLAVAVVVIAATGAFTVRASPSSLGSLVQVSGTSPFADCGVAGQSGTLYRDSEVEPWIAVNPADSRNIVGAWQQDRWSNGGARGLVAGVSRNGGHSWKQVVIPAITLCSGGDYDRASDPWVTFSPNSALYHLALSFNDIAPPFEDRDFDHALLVSKSTDGGETWGDPVEVIRDFDANVFNDKQSITADPHDSNYVYAVWDRLLFPPSERASVIAGFVTFAYQGPAWFARTTDGGLTWEEARPIFDPGTNSQTIGNQIVVLPNGDLVDAFDLITTRRAVIPNQGGPSIAAYYNVAILRSTDQGETWSEEPIVVDRLRTNFIVDPDTGEDVRTGDIIPEVAVDPGNGNLYLVWQDARFNGVDQVAFSMSEDGGFTWSAPVRVNQTPSGVPLGNQQAFTPSVRANADGTVAVTYYDFRNNTPDENTLPTDYFAVQCSGGCTDPANWGNEIRLTDESFDMRQAPFARGYFVGDYEGLDTAGSDFLAFFSQSHDEDPASVFFRTFGP